MLEVFVYFAVIASVCGVLIWWDDRVAEAPGDRRHDHVESALGRGVRFTVSVGVGYPFAYRVECDGVVFGFQNWVQAEDFMWWVGRGGDLAESARRCEGVVLTHPSVLGRPRPAN